MEKLKKIFGKIMLPLILGGGLGFAVGIAMMNILEAYEEPYMVFIILIIAFVSILAAYFFHIAAHEAGHLVFGLLTGYKFQSYRIGNIMWTKVDGKIKLKKMTLAGTAGQCLMRPPEIIDGKMPYLLYNFGGSISNLIFSVIFFILYLIFRNAPIPSLIFITAFLIGLILAILNGVPLKLGLVNNDAYNAISLGKNKNALRSFYIQLRVSTDSAQGMRIRDMPQEWFELPSNEDMKNSLIASLGVLACSRLMDEARFSEAKKLIDKYLEAETSIIGLERSLMICDRIYCGLLEGEDISRFITKPHLKFMKSMNSFPSVIRTEYVIALLLHKDINKACSLKKAFEKTALTFPNKSDIEMEFELIAIADNLAGK